MSRRRYVVAGVDVTDVITALADAAPPLTEAQRDKLRMLLPPVSAAQLASVATTRSSSEIAAGEPA